MLQYVEGISDFVKRSILTRSRLCSFVLRVKNDRVQEAWVNSTSIMEFPRGSPSQLKNKTRNCAVHSRLQDTHTFCARMLAIAFLSSIIPSR
jgi:hypothetical protein